jgi:hypothetical protein
VLNRSHLFFCYAASCCRLWLTAPRPLSAELLSYLAADVRYLPALVLLMERDLLQVRTATASLCSSTCKLCCMCSVPTEVSSQLQGLCGDCVINAVSVSAAMRGGCIRHHFAHVRAAADG